MPRLENWSVGSQNLTPYTAPELSQPRLMGEVYGHPNFDNGERITTSPIEKINGWVITTLSGSVYELGGVSREYEEWYTQAYPEGTADLHGDNPIRDLSPSEEKTQYNPFA